MGLVGGKQTCPGHRWAWASGGGTERSPGAGRGRLSSGQPGHRRGKVVWEPALGWPGREGERKQRGGLLSHRVVVRGGAAQALRQIAVIRDFKRLGEGLATEALLPVRTCSPNPGLPTSGFLEPSLISPLSLQFSLGPCLPFSGSPWLPVSPGTQPPISPQDPAPSPARTVRTTK